MTESTNQPTLKEIVVNRLQQIRATLVTPKKGDNIAKTKLDIGQVIEAVIELESRKNSQSKS